MTTIQTGHPRLHARELPPSSEPGPAAAPISGGDGDAGDGPSTSLRDLPLSPTIAKFAREHGGGLQGGELMTRLLNVSSSMALNAKLGALFNKLEEDRQHHQVEENNSIAKLKQASGANQPAAPSASGEPGSPAPVAAIPMPMGGG